jgi:predicted RNase H-like HicB family nuclease
MIKVGSGLGELMASGFTLRVYKDPPAGYWAEVAELPGCYTQGRTIEEVRERATEAIALYLETLAGQAGRSSEPATVHERPVKTIRFQLVPA